MVQVIYNQEKDRWIKGDRYVRPLVRKLIRRAPARLSGMEKVVGNFLKGLELLGVKYKFNNYLLFTKSTERIISFGLGLHGLEGVNKKSPIIAAIGYPHPLELPALCEDYNIKKFLQHSSWVLAFAKSAKVYKDEIFDLWPAGIDTYEWSPEPTVPKSVDLLIYNKIMWDREKIDNALRVPIIKLLKKFGLTYKEIIYGKYQPHEYKMALNQCRAMIFLCEHESQGIAYQECLSCDIPVFAWDQGFWLDPIRFKYNQPIVPASSIPYFDERCGMRFKNYEDFEKLFPLFWDAVSSNQFSPREYILENLTLETSAKKMLAFYNSL